MEEKGQCMRRKYLIGLFFICLLCIVILIININRYKLCNRIKNIIVSNINSTYGKETNSNEKV